MYVILPDGKKNAGVSETVTVAGSISGRIELGISSACWLAATDSKPDRGRLNAALASLSMWEMIPPFSVRTYTSFSSSADTVEGSGVAQSRTTSVGSERER